MRSPRVRRFPDLLASVLFLASCVGRIDGEGEVLSEAGDSTNPPPSGGQGSTRPSLAGQPSATAGQPPVGGPTAAAPAPGSPKAVAGQVDVGAAPALRRLDNTDLANTVRDLLGSAAWPGTDVSLLADPVGPHGFVTFRAVGNTEADTHRELVESISALAMKSPSTWLPCDLATGDACVRRLAETFGRRAFRRPLETAEVDAFVTLGRTLAAQGLTAAETGRLLLEAFLQDPRFMYHRVTGARWPRAAGDMVPLSGFEIAEKLSYLIWRTMPDETLLTEAGAGRLQSTAAVEGQIMRLLADPRGGRFFEEFGQRWFGLSALSAAVRPFPEFTSQARGSMAAETAAFVRHVALTGDGHVGTLFGSSSSFVDEALGRIYGVTVPPGKALAMTTLPAGQRSGLLTQAGFLTVNSSVIQRGRFVRENIFCQPLPQPPANAAQMGGMPDPKASQRTQAQMHSAAPACRSCHQLIDPIGFGLLNYDSIGRYRTTDVGKPVDARSVLSGTDVDGEFQSVGELLDRVARSESVRRCVATQVFRHVHRRDESAEDAVVLASLSDGFLRRDQLRDLFVSVALSDTFLKFRALPGEAP